ncbi:MAG TPA: hypothetical protein PLH92_17865, partial [Mycobacterium sp.]|nr:hypothetical protein [Mycobacterium sp.]
RLAVDSGSTGACEATATAVAACAGDTCDGRAAVATRAAGTTGGTVSAVDKTAEIGYASG